MKEKIPQHVILDLLPLYFADEVSEETRDLIEAYLKTDPQLARLAEQAKQAPALQEIPAPLNKETEMKAYKKGRKLMIEHLVFLAAAVASSIMIVPGYKEYRDYPVALYLMGAVTIIFWLAFFWVNWKIDD
jgi:hypothetical protein